MPDQDQHPLAKWFGERKMVRLMLLAALLTLAVIYIHPIISGVVLLWNIAKPLIAGAAIAYILEIIVKRLEVVLFPSTKHAWLAKSRRAISIMISLLVVVSILTLIVFTVIPGLTEAVTLLAQELPVYFTQLKNWALETFKDVAPVTEAVQSLKFDWEDIQGRVAAWALNGMTGGRLLSSTVSVISAVMGQIANFFIALIFAVFLLGSKKKLQDQSNHLLAALLNDNNERRMKHVLSTANRCFSGFIIGQTLSGLILGVCTWLGMRIFRMPYSLIVAVLSGTTSLIPIIGGYIGAALGTFLVFTANPGMALWFLLFIVALQTVLGNTVYPKLMGSSVGIPSLWVLVAITLGGGIGGIGGMLVSVPFVATLYALLQEWVRSVNKKESAARLKE